MHRADRPPSRRAFLDVTGATVAAGLLAGCSGDSARSDDPAPPASSAPTTPPPVAVTGRHQAGVTLPRTAQPHLLALVADLDDAVPPGPLLAELGETIQTLAAGSDPRLLGLSPGDVTVTVGVGPRLVRTAGDTLPGAADLPEFSHERVAARDRDGDLLLQICAGDPLLLPVTAAALLDQAGDRLQERWRQFGRRGAEVPVAEDRSAPRNLLGFIDGIVGPHTTAEQERDLWLADPPAVADGTLAVLRRMEIDLTRFAALSVGEQEAVFGRRRASGEPLSGGGVDSAPGLNAKTPEGRYLIPVDAHVRRSNPTVVGVGHMLRRSYSIDAPAPGLLFISFQNDLRTFTATLARMDTSDALLPFTTTTASATFLILPGYTPQRPLGSTLFG
ncbi:Dyp-type peroxidase [Streptomyces sp. DSM 44915]|uniref:Dyp-type peroxidase n=1 Tax=Streptomyces chisholmiae TaxID=3075540 RepID=A0ABU2JVT3_9ACTN|nr:Dyp-type peroxidase [Streptomyces sp. DSM 44915]MDT0269072.1 Dyp-type peroxidase [Streptomyces sp. DSM 44915]